MKRFITALIICVLIFPAATAGSTDPLVPLSYLTETYVPAVESAQSALIGNKINDFKEKFGFADSASFPGTAIYALKEGGSVELGELTVFTVINGTAVLYISSGEVINLTSGAPAAQGVLAAAGNRYITAEGSSASLLVYSPDAEVIAESPNSVSVSGTIPAVRRFLDVPETHWANAYIAAVFEKGIVNGVGDYKFAPDGTVTRAMFVTMLGRLAKIDTAAYPDSAFVDVGTDTWYGAYVAWAAQNSYVNGTGDGVFNPDGSITREQIAVILYRFSPNSAPGSNGIFDDGTPENRFTDADAINDWALDAVNWARDAGLIGGYEDGSFAPAKTATRAEVCTIISRMGI